MNYKKFAAYKLVRKFTKKQLETQGIHSEIKEIPRGKYLYQLKYKLIEESREVLKTNNKNSLIDELGDVLSVFHVILKENNISMSTVLDSMNKKEAERGVIGNYFMTTFDVPDGHELMQKYINAGYKEANKEFYVDKDSHNKQTMDINR
jgi:phosphoribosyl-ATP pyrophosphohydrolase